MREKSSASKMARLIVGANLYGLQQWERTVLGGREEFEDVKEENTEIVDDMLPIIEKALDEDLLEDLDDAERFVRKYVRAWSTPYMWWLDPLAWRRWAWSRER